MVPILQSVGALFRPEAHVPPKVSGPMSADISSNV